MPHASDFTKEGNDMEKEKSKTVPGDMLRHMDALLACSLSVQRSAVSPAI